VTEDGLTIRSVGPRYGSTAGGELVTIAGSGFKGNLYVLIGGRAATGYAVSPTMLVVTTPAHVAGTVDVEVGLLGGGSVVYPGGYDYRDPDPGTGTVPTPGRPLPAPPAGGSPGGGGSTPIPTTPSPAPEPGTPGAPPTTASPGPAPTVPDGAASPSPETTAPPTPIRVPVRFSFGPEEANRGLRLRPVTGGPDLADPSTWGVRACAEASCPGTRL
jgi:hypothetical protein